MGAERLVRRTDWRRLRIVIPVLLGRQRHGLASALHSAGLVVVVVVVVHNPHRPTEQPPPYLLRRQHILFAGVIVLAAVAVVHHLPGHGPPGRSGGVADVHNSRNATTRGVARHPQWTPPPPNLKILGQTFLRAFGRSKIGLDQKFSSESLKLSTAGGGGGSTA